MGRLRRSNMRVTGMLRLLRRRSLCRLAWASRRGLLDERTNAEAHGKCDFNG